MCLNPSVLIGAGAVTVAVAVLAPGLLGATLPLLAVAICPLSMLLMARGMSGGKAASHTDPGRPADVDAQIARLCGEIRNLEAHRAATAELTRQDH